MVSDFFFLRVMVKQVWEILPLAFHSQNIPFLKYHSLIATSYYISFSTLHTLIAAALLLPCDPWAWQVRNLRTGIMPHWKSPSPSCPLWNTHTQYCTAHTYELSSAHRVCVHAHAWMEIDTKGKFHTWADMEQNRHHMWLWKVIRSTNMGVCSNLRQGGMDLEFELTSWN